MRRLPLSEGGLPCERRYNETGGLPWYREYEETRATKEEAFADAQQWAREYEALDRFGNRGHRTICSKSYANEVFA